MQGQLTIMSQTAGINHDSHFSAWGLNTILRVHFKQHVIELQEHLSQAICHTPPKVSAAVLP